MVTGLLALHALAQDPGGGLVAKLTLLADSYRQEAGASGLIIAVGRGDEVVAAVASGTPSSRSRIGLKPDALVMVGSVSKSLTAGLVARKVDRGIIRWNTTLASVFPDLQRLPAGACAQATLEQVLCHRTGLDRPFAPTVAKRVENGTEFHRALLNAAFTMKPVGNPGERYQYNSSASFAAAMLERLTGESYVDSMRKEFFEPLGLKTFEMGRPWTRSSETSLVSEINLNGSLVEAPSDWQPQLAYDASGGWSCSLPELVRLSLVQTYKSKWRLVSAASLDRLFQDPYGDGYSLGWAGRRQSTWKTHGGSTGLGDTTVLAIAPRIGMAFAFTFNRNTGDPGIQAIRDRLTRELQVTLLE